jgi:hypothetical protein
VKLRSFRTVEITLLTKSAFNKLVFSDSNVIPTKRQVTDLYMDVMLTVRPCVSFIHSWYRVIKQPLSNPTLLLLCVQILTSEPKV